MKRNRPCRRGFGPALAVAAALALAVSAAPAFAACRVTDFTDKPLASLGELQRLSFESQMLRTEFERLKAKPAGDPNHDPLIAGAASAADARRAALAKLQATGIENVDDYRLVWASDFLSDEQLQRFTNCVSSRQPGLTVAGRMDSPGRFHMTFTHLTPIGIEKIPTRVIASHNIANLAELEAHLAELGLRDNYPARTFPLQIADPAKRAVLVLRAGWETPKFLYIPVYPTSVYQK